MGASAWIYFGPYHNDLVQSFAILCQKVFEESDYYFPEGKARPVTIQEVLDTCGIDGTHSVLDYMHSGRSYTIQSPEESVQHYLLPLTEQGLNHLFGTTQPTHEMIEEQIDPLWEYVLDDHEEVEGNYVIAYKDGKPNEWFVMGITGD